MGSHPEQGPAWLPCRTVAPVREKILVSRVSPRAAGKRAAMWTEISPQKSCSADVIELVMADHRRIRRLREMLENGVRRGPAGRSGWMRIQIWDRLAELLEAHMSAEEEICYLPMSRSGSVSPERRLDAVADHDDIREAISEARLQFAGSPLWWAAARAVLAASGDHLDREERDMLAGWLPRLTMSQRLELGNQWLVFTAARWLEPIPVRRAGVSALRPGAGPLFPGGVIPGENLSRVTT